MTPILYLRARYYDTSIGRFVSTDPAKGSAFEPATLHKYLYAANNPVMYSDPSGMFFGLSGLSLTQSIMTTISVSYALSSIVLPNVSSMFSKASGSTDSFTIQFFAGGSFGNILYFGAIDAYIWEEPHSKTNKVLITRRRGLFTVYLIGFGVGAGATLISPETTFTTESNRRIENFDGYGRISAVEAAFQGAGGISLAEMQMPDGTQIPLSISIASQISSGLTAYVATAIFQLNFIDHI